MLKAVGWYLFNVWVAIDQLATALLGGWPDETLSSYAWRLEKQGKFFGFTRRLIDALFFWQEAHCYNAMKAEMERRQLPAELRGLVVVNPPSAVVKSAVNASKRKRAKKSGH